MKTSCLEFENKLKKFKQTIKDYNLQLKLSINKESKTKSYGK